MTVPPTSTTILAATAWKSNAELIAACNDLGYLDYEWVTLDATYGQGTWWKVFRPRVLHTNDLDIRTNADCRWDFRELPWADREFRAVTFDPPYKLNGTPTENVDGRYGVGEYASRDARTQLILDGITECARVSSDVLLVKCQDQVNGGKVRWQSREFADHAEAQGFRLVDQLLKLGGRPQPAGRSQQHARRNYSTLLVLRREAT